MGVKRNAKTGLIMRRISMFLAAIGVMLLAYSFMIRDMQTTIGAGLILVTAAIFSDIRNP